MHPRHPAAGGGHQRPSTVPSPCLPCTNGLSYGHEATTNVRGAPSAAASEHWLESLTGVRPSRSGQPSPDVLTRGARTRRFCWLTFSIFIPTESSGVITWLTQRQCDLPRTNQWRFPLPLSFAEYQLRFRSRQRWEFTTQFACLSAWRVTGAWTCPRTQPDSGH
jgi:hypothetical protein